MVRLSGAVVDAVVDEYGCREFLRRVSDPYWFQAFSCVIGFDWHSSGTTTTSCGALKVALDPKSCGIFVAGGKGRVSRQTQSEIGKAGEVFSLGENDISSLQYASRMAAKVDNSCIQDGFQLYHHVIFFTESREWAVVQQGMGEDYARRYHWLSEGVDSFVEEPHTGIGCDIVKDSALDMTAPESADTRKVCVDLVCDNPSHLKKYFKSRPQKTLTEFAGTEPEAFKLPHHHPVLPVDLTPSGLKTLEKAYEIQPESYEELISVRGMGPQKIRALALISELVYGAKPSFRDPVKYSFSHGGKDGFPYPVDRKTYDNSIQVLRDAVEEARVGRKDKVQALKRLRDFL